MYSSFGCVVIFISVVGSEKTFKRTTAVPGSLAFLFSFVFIYLLILSLCGSKSLTGVGLALRKVKLLKRTKPLKFQRGGRQKRKRGRLGRKRVCDDYINELDRR